MATIEDTNNSKPLADVGFIAEPKTVQELEHNAFFQLNNVDGWMSVKDYECALIKARCLVDALEKLVDSASLR